MAIWKNIFSTKKKDNGIVTTGGLEILSKILAPEFTDKNYLEQYGKSLYVFACISKIANKVASIPFEMYRIINSKGDVKEITSHPALDLLYKVNPFQTKSEFLEITMINMKCTGNAFWYKVRNNGGKVVELWNLRPDWMTIITDPTKFIKEYKFTKENGAVVSLAPEDVIHFKYPDPLSQYLGMSPIKPCQTRVETEDYASRYQRDFFVNSARPDAVIKNPTNALDADQKKEIREDWEKKFRGVGKTSKVAILDGGMEYQVISLTQKEMDYIESMKFTRDDILVAFGVPKPIVAVTDDVNRANAETAMYIFLSEVIKPEITRLVEKINEMMIYPDFGEEFYIDFPDPTPANRDLQLRENKEGIESNYLLINEVRQKEGLPAIKGGWSIYMPIINQAVGGLSQAETKSVKLGGENEAEAFETGKQEKVKRFSFKGHYWLQKKFEMKEDLEKVLSGMKKKEVKITKSPACRQDNESVNDCVARKIPEITVDRPDLTHDQVVGMAEGICSRLCSAKNYKPFFTTAELKKAFAEMVNKKIDSKTLKLKEGANGFAMGQQARVLAKLNEQKDSKAEKIVVSVQRIFDKKSEDGLAIEFITPYLESYLREAGIEALDMIAPQEDFQTTLRVRAFIKKRAQEFAESVNSTTLQGLSDTLAEGMAAGEGIRELANRVEAEYGDFPAWRSELIARTEATASNNEGMLEGYKQSGVANGKEWINAGDERVRLEHQDGVGVGGEIVGINDPFSNGLQYPQEPNCRCVLGAAFLE
jgi:HK97 family phage portal protein